VSRPNVTDVLVEGLKFAQACVLDQRASSHRRKDYTWDPQYRDALDAIGAILAAHKKAAKKKPEAGK
jgi:hypothetical protein